MATPPPQPRPVNATPDGIELFVDGAGKPIVMLLTPITRITVMKKKDAAGKVVEKTPLDTLSGTVWMGIGITILAVVIIRVVVMMT